MGSKGDSGSGQTYIPQQTTPDASSYIGPIMDMVGQQTAFTQQMVANSNANIQRALDLSNQASQSTMPEVTSYVDDIDFDAKNAELQEKIDADISAEDIKRKGVLGTILTGDDDDDLTTVKASLLGGTN